MKQAHQGWIDPSIYLEHIYVADDCLDLSYTREILERANLPWSIVAAGSNPNDLAIDFVGNLGKGKRQLYLCTNHGAFFKPCPATREYRCCEYQVLNIGANCPIDCAYCILQAYLNNPWMTFYVNTGKLFDELDIALSSSERSFYRIGTGEFTDSLAIDRLTRLSPQLVNYFRDKKNAVLELKTKSAVVDNLQGLDHGGRTVVAWSLNASSIMARQEIRAASLEQRLAAAARCASWGYRLAFHFDPIIYGPDWRQEYEETIEKLFAAVDPKAICWVSLGAFRFLPALKEIGEKRFPAVNSYCEEFVTGLDNKQRYFRSRRAELYSHLYHLIKARTAPHTCIYFCMESDEIWQEVAGFKPEEYGGLAAMLDRSATTKI